MTLAGVRELAVGLVDDDEVGELHDPALEPLQLVPSAGRDEDEEEIDHRGDLHFRLPDTDGFDEDDVETRLPRTAASPRAYAGRLHRAFHPSATAGRTRAAIECSSSIRVLSPRIDPPLRVLDGSTARTATRCSRSTSVQPERLDERRLPGPGRPGDADPDRVARVWQHVGEQLFRVLTVITPRGLDQRDRPRQRAPIAVDHLLSERVHPASLPA